MIKHTVLENIYQEIKQYLRVVGKMMKDQEWVKKYGQMVQYFKDNIIIIKKMGKVNLDGQMEINMLENLKIIIKMDKEL